MSRVELPDNQWAELAEPRQVTERRRRPYVTATTLAAMSVPRDEKGDIVAGGVGAEQMDLVGRAADLLMVALVKQWSFDLPIEVDALQDLTGETYDALRKATNAIASDLMPDFSPTPDPTAPTGE